MTELSDPGEPVLEPAARQLAEETSPHPRIYEVPPEQGRAILVGLQSGEGVDKPGVEEQWVDVPDGPTGRIRTRIVRPEGLSGRLPVVLYLHGAGWVFGDETTHDRLVRELAVGVQAAVVFPVYDRAPEAKYPIAVEQCYAVGRWVTQHGNEHDLDGSRLAVCGDSVGGNMAAAFALMCSERGDIEPKAQVLLYPVTDANFETASYRQFADGYYLTRDGMKWFWDQYTTEPAQRAEPHAAPLRASIDQLRGLPPTLVITGEADVLRDEGEAYAAKLRAAGVEVTAVRVLGMVHDFLMLDSLRDCHATKLARNLAVEALAEALHGPIARTTIPHWFTEPTRV
ncbi:alpha/beta hydrolase [Nocardia donostiensis]|uniref:Esterase n=1 Tax=Nocardia donostiensis TaxID=1538463 RepID=A0A1W0AYC2_9NOCA|nr:alpha/beta hydrolase [Nocardia donostiensis]ONM47091.1 esterase [Nocardia donostiensis]OQS15238.1 esterase [Nocardia donostiensis]OQS20076.1 esterase [Nocardia donostiensis]